MTHQHLVRLVQRRLQSLDMTPADLYRTVARRSRGRGKRRLHWVSKQTVYNFAKHGNVVKSDTLVSILRVLGLDITVRPSQKEQPR
jgi:hypothetical protein